MGKIKIATLGSEEEAVLKDKQRVKREEKKKRELSQKVHVPGMKGGQRVKSVGASEEEIEKLAKLAETVEKDQQTGIHPGKEDVKPKKSRVRNRSKLYKQALMKVDHNRLYPIGEGLTLLREVALAKFDETVELHLNTSDKGMRGNVQLPHGTGKEMKVAIADAGSIDKLLEDLEKGKIDFDLLIAQPSVMGKLAKVAKFLGPKGLMPNPKNGTISEKPEEVAKKFQGGSVNWKTEAEFPIIHAVIGKLSFKDKQLEENFRALIKSITPDKIQKVTLKSSMSPGIKIQIA